MRPRRSSIALTVTLMFSSVFVPQPARAADCDFSGLPRINSSGISQENCTFDTTSNPNFIEFQTRILSEARENREYVDTRLQKIELIYSDLPRPGDLVSTGSLQEKIKTWESERNSLKTRFDSLATAAKEVINNSKKNDLNRLPSLYDWLLFDNREDLSPEVRQSSNPRQKASIESYEVQVADTTSGTPLYLRTTVKSVSPYAVFVDFSSYASVSGVLENKKVYQTVIDRRENLSFSYATQWAQGLKWKVGDPIYLDGEGSIALVEKRWLLNGQLYETWLTRVNYPNIDLGRAQFRLSDWGSPECLRVVLAPSDGGGIGCQNVKALSKEQARVASVNTLESDFKRLYQMYQDSQALALILGKEYVKYPDYMSKVSDDLLLDAERISAQALQLKEDLKIEVDLARKVEIDAAVKASKKRLTITCVKGKKIKKIKDIEPKCPKGYKKK